MSASPPQHSPLPSTAYFSQSAALYNMQSGHATLTLLADVIKDDVQPSRTPFGPDSVVHDNAAGPGIGAAALIARLPRYRLPQEVLVSDEAADMVSAAQESLAFSAVLPSVVCCELDSQKLDGIPNSYFTHSIINFSIFDFVRPADAVYETYRTLRPGGLAIFTCWRRFAPMLMVHAAQKMIRPDLPLMPTPRPEFCMDGVLQDVVEEGGFARHAITVCRKDLLVTDSRDQAGLITYMSGHLMKKAREGYTDEEEQRWIKAVFQAVDDEIGEFGGIKFEAYVVLAKKSIRAQ